MATHAWMMPLMLSLKVAAWATIIATVTGVTAAWFLSRWRSALADMVDAVLTLPLVLPPTVIGYYLLVLLGRRGWLGEYLAAWGVELVFTWQGAVVAAAIVAFPLVLKGARAAFEEVDTHLEDAARLLGVSNWGVWCRVSLPLAARGILAGVLLAFARALGEFGATLMVAGSIPGRTQTLSIAIYEAVQQGEDATANFLVALASVTCIAALWGARWLSPRHIRMGRRQ
ncbi:MAG: molybdate ABC transporter permease subunit [Castellaniella sp.]